MKPVHHLVANVTLNHTTMAGGRVLVSLYAINQHAPPVVVGILVGLFAILPLLISVAIGRLVDRIGTRAPMIVCSLLIIAGTVLPFLLPGLLVTLGCMALMVGGGYFAMFIVHSNLGGYYGEPQERASNFAQISLGLSAGNGFGPLLAGFSVDLVGFRTAFLLLAAPALAAFVLFALGKLPQRGPVAIAGEAGAAGRTKPKRSVTDLLGHPRMRPVYLMSLYFMMLWDIFMVLTPLYGAELHVSASQIGIIIGTFSAASFIVRIFMAWLLARFSPMQLLIMALTVGAGAMLVFGTVETVPLLIVIAFAVGMGHGLGAPMATTALYDASPPDRISESIGLRVSVGKASQAVLPLLAGGAASVIGIAPLFWVTALGLLTGAWLQRAHWHDRRESKAGG